MIFPSHHMSDAELVRHLYAQPGKTDLELELAYRLEQAVETIADLDEELSEARRGNDA